MKELEYIPELHPLARIPDEEWLLFIVLRYRQHRPIDSMKKDLLHLMQFAGKEVEVPQAGRLVFFGRIESSTLSQDMPYHWHLLIGKRFFTTPGASKDDNWLKSEYRESFFKTNWKHGDAFVEPYDSSKGNGVGYDCKRRENVPEDCFFSKGLQKLIWAHTEGGQQ